MADLTLPNRSPLSAPPFRMSALTITEIPDIATASLAMRRDQDTAFAAASEAMFGASLPGPGQSMTAGNRTVWWAGQDQWLVDAPDATFDLAGDLKAAFGDTASITEQTGAHLRFDLKGDGCLAVLERLCALDTSLMTTGDAVRTPIHHVGVHLICRETARHFSIIAPSSFAGSIHEALLMTARSAL